MTVIDEATLTCTAPASSLAAGPFVDVVVANANGSAALSHEYTSSTKLLTDDFSGTLNNPSSWTSPASTRSAAA